MNETVLIVDEDANARIIAETLLRLRGLHVVCAKDGSEARDIVQCEGVAVVVIGLPDCGPHSLQSVQALRAQVVDLLSPAPPIVVVAGRSDPEGYRDALRASADVFLRKPAEPKQFVAIVERLLDSAGRSEGPSAEAATVTGW